MKPKRAAELCNRLFHKLYRDGVPATLRKAACRIRDRAVRPLIERQYAFSDELQRLRDVCAALEARAGQLEQFATASDQRAIQQDACAAALGALASDLDLRASHLELRAGCVEQQVLIVGQDVSNVSQNVAALQQFAAETAQQAVTLGQHVTNLNQRATDLEQHSLGLERGITTLGHQVADLGTRITVQEEHGASLDYRTTVNGQQIHNCDLRVAALELTTELKADADRRILQGHSASILWLAEHHSSVTATLSAEPAKADVRPSESEAGQLLPINVTHAPAGTPTLQSEPREAPLVSIIMPVWNRESTVGRALDSILAQTWTDWELLIVDDGSTDGTRDAIRPYETDRRIRYQCQTHAGAAVARNLALAESRGEVIAYLDSDNTWYPGALAAFVQAFQDDPQCDAAYFAHVWQEQSPETTWIRSLPFDFDALLNMTMGIDLNAFGHRRRLYERHGGFDTTLTRLMDWDLILRYTAEQDPRQLPVIGGRYEAGRRDSISAKESFSRNEYLVRRKFEEKVHAPLRALYALAGAGQCDDPATAAEVACLRRWGAEIEFWCDEPGATLEGSTANGRETIHTGPLSAALRHLQPDILHVAGLERARTLRDAAAEAGIPMTVRADDASSSPQLIGRCLHDPAIRAIYLDAAAAHEHSDNEKVRELRVCFSPDRCPPESDKDPRLVFCIGSRAMDEFLAEVAAQCPEHRFVADWAVGPDEARAALRTAAICLHVPADTAACALPASGCEAMATGACVIERRSADAEAVPGREAPCYTDAAEAADLILATACWNSDDWRRARVQAIDRAYPLFADSVVLRPLVEDWVRIIAESTATCGLSSRAC